MKRKIYLQLYFGPFAPTLLAQLRQHKFKFDIKKGIQYEQLGVCIDTLYFKNVLSESDRDKARRKLFIIIKKHIQKKNK